MAFEHPAKRESGSAVLGTQDGNAVLAAADALRHAVGGLTFSAPVAVVYNPLEYAWEAHRLYAQRFAPGPKRVLFLGMNPGPFGMAQTGVPFGEVAAVRDWMGVEAPVRTPPNPHPKRPVLGFACTKSEVSGRRLWGLMAERFGGAEEFFREHYVLNYCPLVFMEVSGRNITPDKLRADEARPLFAACDAHLQAVVDAQRPAWCIGVGAFAAARFSGVDLRGARAGSILHPSPASPAANRGWAQAATRQLESMGVWPSPGGAVA